MKLNYYESYVIYICSRLSSKGVSTSYRVLNNYILRSTQIAIIIRDIGTLTLRLSMQKAMMVCQAGATMEVW